jgi:DNA topoisomerase VI subunit B
MRTDDNRKAPPTGGGKGKGGGNGTFERKVFSTSRLAEFASISEMEKQTGQPVGNWLLVIIKELCDNALDEMEGAGVAPVIEIAVDGASITVADRGRGIKPAVVKALTDYSAKQSSRAAVVAPTRGQQGNALHSIIAMGYLLANGGDAGETVIESKGVAHTLRFAIDPVRRTPVVTHTVTPSEVKTGTRITVRWPDEAREIIAGGENGFFSLVEAYAWLNPHLALDVKWNTGVGNDAHSFHREWEATDTGWTKWRPNMPSSAHWYDVERLSNQMANEIAYAEDHRTPSPSVRDFVGQFRGLKSTQTQAAIRDVLGVVERETLAEFFKRPNAAARMLKAMREMSRPIKLGELGWIGAGHLDDRLIDDDCDGGSIAYRRQEIVEGGVPYVIEVAFGYRPDPDEAQYGLRVVEGFNFAPAIGGSPFQLKQRLASLDVDDDDPVTLFAHMTSPRFSFADKGKAKINLPDTVAAKLTDMVTAVTKTWTKQKLDEIRHADAVTRRMDALVRRDRPMKQTKAAASVMVLAYMFASANGTLPANPRQIFYAARPRILKLTGLQKIDSKYFTQTLLPNFMNANPDETADWNIAWDDRGHFAEPHTERVIGLGTLAVRTYIKNQREMKIEPVGLSKAKVTTYGPKGRYAGVLYIEKEGFTAILDAARIAARFDLAIASNKGMSVTACRMLVEELCGRQGLPLFILHDLDKAGFSIKHTLFNSNRRYTFEHEIEPIDLGLRLADIEDFERAGQPLQAEPVHIVIKRKKKSEGDDEDDDAELTVESLEAARANLRKNGATPAEIMYLLTPMEGHATGGKRVELNAMASDVFIAFVERKLIAHGLGKVVPSKDMLGETYAAFKRSAMARATLGAELARLNTVPVKVPANLDKRVRAYLKQHPHATWDAAVRALLEGER